MLQQMFMVFIQQLNSSVVVLLFILVAVGILLFKIGKWTERHTNHTERLKRVEGWHEIIVRLEEKVNLIYRFRNPNGTVHNESPMALTKRGEQIRKDICLDGILNQYINDLIKTVKARNIGNNPYKIQMESMDIATHELANKLSVQEKETIQTAAFKAGLLEEDILIIMGILLRDSILAENNIPVADIDKQ